ncbi:hypothetical protein DPMN_182162 [Dreissena polymorpha]|uniref:Uncharacterized protein n=1 Tax=Dreissena polymorpha TaxID=45954 RepID=A0A9D4DFB2_DREPO|nr:hypothetical protein DPMN_182162 [Dreissena polymorpha]
MNSRRLLRGCLAAREPMRDWRCWGLYRNSSRRPARERRAGSCSRPGRRRAGTDTSRK